MRRRACRSAVSPLFAHFFPMNIRRLPHLIFLLASVSFFASCAVFHSGAPSASVVVTADSGTEVEAAVTGAFVARNFHLASNVRHDLTFERDASGVDGVLYGNWNDDKLADRVVVQVIELSAGKYRLSCLPYAVRGLGTGMDDAVRRFQIYSSEYSTALRQVRRTLEREQ